MEKTGGADKADHLAGHTMVQARLKGYTVTARRETKSTKKAPPTTFAFLAAFEFGVIEEARPTFERMFCWYRCVRVARRPRLKATRLWRACFPPRFGGACWPNGQKEVNQ